MKLLIALLLLCAAGFGQTNDASRVGRYQMLAVKAPSYNTAGSISAFEEVFMLDTATGRVWKYEPQGKCDNDGTACLFALPDFFKAVDVDHLNGFDRMQELRDIAKGRAEYDKEQQQEKIK